MPPLQSSDVRPADLTRQQIVASGTPEKRLFIDAGPGTGKTTVAAQRFGALRFSAEARNDHRSVTAVSFTKAATSNLRRRLTRIWGPVALGWPHRVVTLDTIMYDLLHDLLDAGLLRWPTGHTELTVVDSWNAFSQSAWTDASYEVFVESGEIRFRRITLNSTSRVPIRVIKEKLMSGICTHQDVRDALEASLNDSSIADRIRARWVKTTRALIVDEVFDANELDAKVIELAIEAGLSVTLVGDPWQALYVFRGARPEAIRDLLLRTGTRTLVLNDSFRWRDPAQRQLASDLRAGRAVSLVPSDHHAVDVVLAVTWKQLWAAGERILPLAFQSFKGGSEEAAATLLLNHVTSTVFGRQATYLTEALLALGIDDPDITDQVYSKLQDVLDLLARNDKMAVTNAYSALAEVIKSVSSRQLRPAHHAHTRRLADLASRLAHADKPILGLTTHQAKGGEWDVVGVVLSRSERDRLLIGLDNAEETDRKLYVACTRARYRTLLINT
ncbi:UvrD-helicase domain-containing protein [Actinokineospora terrae]|uniref:UvrD-helicase domain-containing protein n=1 Tax=Actinokineospora terrae TaxID=155974 RepID=UPI0011604644|nr:UvrD-helicase domain-containing protein [Actinokineospora terrae]